MTKEEADKICKLLAVQKNIIKCMSEALKTIAINDGVIIANDVALETMEEVNEIYRKYLTT